MVVVSSCREVSGLSAYNERNPCMFQLLTGDASRGTLDKTASVQAVRKVGMTSNQHGPYIRGDTRVTMVRYKGQLPSRGGCESLKPYLSSDRSLQLDSVKLDSLVIAISAMIAVNTFPGLVHTARQAMGAGGT